MKIKERKIAIIGFGKEGLSAANFLGKENTIAIFDQKPKSQIDRYSLSRLRAKNVDFYFGNTFPSVANFDFVIRSPGVRPDNPLLAKLITHGAIPTSPTKIFFDLSPAKIIGVTGTKGKGTTSTLIYQMLATQFAGVYLAGNIGTPALDILPKLTPDSLVVLELSSFQLLDLGKSPHIAVVLMITQEHLDWHKDRDDYQKAKESIVAFQERGDFAVINQDFAHSLSFAKKTKAKVYFVSTYHKTNGVYVSGEQIYSEISNRQLITKTTEVALVGRHNLQNVVAATAAALLSGIKIANIKKVLKTFRGLPHRLELVSQIDDVKFYNDSFSTTPETTIAAIEAFPNPKVLILGGSSKKSDFTSLGQKIVKDRGIKSLILMGEETTSIQQAVSAAGSFGGKIIRGLKDMETIVKAANREAKAGDVVILSPAAASFDMFKNYQDRGQKFVKAVKNLKG